VFNFEIEQVACGGVNMNYNLGFGFLGGFLLGALVGAAAALLLAPYSGEETREQIRTESIALRDRGQEFGNDRIHDAQKMVKQGKRGVSDAQTRLGREIEDQKDNLQAVMGVGK
jgi:gas vesicle protein